ncbi:hypothetical protein C5167_046946 [Papaver somniferum]|uniref:DUF7876 domain-containing protein n=1 Tax=Papaver somniferum TaxID=3469 RepID=A0A4Y7LHN2_PAPSO|nr:hypothetical protein C5167_046946 [Papaver somniferum]
MAVVGHSEGPSFVASRMQFVFSTLEFIQYWSFGANIAYVVDQCESLPSEGGDHFVVPASSQSTMANYLVAKLDIIDHATHVQGIIDICVQAPKYTVLNQQWMLLESVKVKGLEMILFRFL